MRRRRFFVAYFAVAVIGSVAAFFGAPLVKASIAPERLVNMIAACRSEAPIQDLISAALAPRTRQPEPPEFDRPPGSQPRVRPGTSAQTPGTRSDAGAAALTQPPSKADTPPASCYNYSAMWAVVTNESAAVYDSSGNLAQELGAGTLVEVAAVRQGQAGSLAICRYDTRPKNMDVAIIRAKDLLIRNGSLDSANADLVVLLRKQVQLDIEIRALVSSSESELARNNPHSDDYNAARSAVVSFNEKAKALRARAEKSSGTARVETMDKLRSMKEEEVLIRRKYEASRTAFDEWNRQHGGASAESDAIKSLRERLAEVRTQIARMDSR